MLGSILVASVGSVLAAKLSHAGVHVAAAQAVLAHKDIVGSGIAPTGAHMPQQLQHAITTASKPRSCTACTPQ